MSLYKKVTIVFDWLKTWTGWSLVKPHEIYEAVLNKDHKRLKILLILANTDTINSKDLEESPLDLAASQGDEISVELLLAYEAIPDYDQRLHFWRRSTLSRAILSGNHKVIQLLINQGCDPEVIFEINSWQEIRVNTFPYNYWYKIVALNNVPIFQLLLECTGRIVRGEDEWSSRILITACGLGSDAIVEYLLDQSVNIESMDDSRWTCAFFAVGYGQISTLRLLVARGANLKHIDIRGRTLLHIAVLYYTNRAVLVPHEIIQFLYDNGLDINATDNDGLTPISLSFLDFRDVQLNMAYYLLNMPDINFAIPDVNGVTLLHRMVNKVRPCLTQILCRLNVDINAKDNRGRTPLHYYETEFRTLFILLGFGVDTSVLHSLTKDILNNNDFLKILFLYKIIRSLANLSSDPNIDTILAPHHLYMKDGLELSINNEILRMKETIICEKLTFYDFLHAKKRALVKIAQNHDIYQILLLKRYGFYHFQYMIIKNYLYGKRPLTIIESQAITHAERNLDVIFNYQLPNLIVYNVKKYMDIEDLITLENMIIS